MMKRMRSESPSVRISKLSLLLMGLGALYLVLVCLKFPKIFESATVLSSEYNEVSKEGLSIGGEEHTELSKPRLSSVYKDGFHRILQNSVDQNAPPMPREEALEEKTGGSTTVKPLRLHYGRIAAAILRRRNRTTDFSIVEKMADEAWALGMKAWEEVDKFDGKEIEMNSILEGKPESCPSWVSMNGEELARGDNIMFLPCGLAAGSSITVIGTPRIAHQEYVPQLVRLRIDDSLVLVSQFMVELQGLKAVVGEDPPKILHLNPRLRGDWSHRPVIEHNTCYRMQWGTAQRCDGLRSKNDDDMLGKGSNLSFYTMLSACDYDSPPKHNMEKEKEKKLRRQIF